MSAQSAAYDHVLGYRWHQGRTDQAEALNKLEDLADLRRAVDERISDLVSDARIDGLRWHEIGEPLDLSASTTARRYGGGGR